MKIIKKLFFAWNEDKEKAFLESMAKDGYKLANVKFGKYIFEKTEPQNLIYQFDFKGISNISDDEYIELFEDTGWELCCKYGSWYYFCKQYNENDSTTEIYNDNSSKKAKYRRLIAFLLIVGFPLYYQNIIFFPNMAPSRLEYPSFYFFFRPISIILALLHVFALIKLIIIYKRISKNIKE